MVQYTVHNPENLFNLNKEIITALSSGKPTSIIRIGNMEGYFLETMYNNNTPLQEFVYWLTLTSGVHPGNDLNYLKDIWSPINCASMQNADILGFVDISGAIQNNSNFVKEYCKDKITFYGVQDILVLDPGFLINKQITNVECSNPWTKYLKNKKALVISSHVETIKSQWKNIDNIWGKERENITPFDLVEVIRAPFHPMMDDRQYSGCNTWDETLSYLCKEMDKVDYDVALISAGAWAPALADHAKNTGKIGITICGVLQLFFGILGSRWTGKNVDYLSWNKLFNEHWVYPMQNDLPKNKNVFDQFEKAYW